MLPTPSQITRPHNLLLYGYLYAYCLAYPQSDPIAINVFSFSASDLFLPVLSLSRSRVADLCRRSADKTSIWALDIQLANQLALSGWSGEGAEG